MVLYFWEEYLLGSWIYLGNCLEYVGVCSKLSPLLQGGHEKFLIQSCVSFDQHCISIIN